MSKPHVAFIVESSHGHVNPTLGTTEELVSRGHHVSHAVKESYANRVAAHGSEPVIYRPLENRFRLYESVYAKSSDAGFPFDFSHIDSREAGRLFKEEMQDTLGQLLELYQARRPDLIVFDRTNEAGRMLAEQWDIPTIEYSPQLIFDSVLTYDSNKVIVTLPKFLQRNVEQLDSRFHFVGPVFSKQKTFSVPWQGSEGSRKVILVSATTGLLPQVDFFIEAAQAFSALPYRVLLSIEQNIDPAKLGRLPANCVINHFYPQREILPHCRLFVGHGGPSSTCEALACGVPLLLLPPSQAHDEYASRIAMLGLGVSLKGHAVSAANLKQAATALLNDRATLERVKRVQKELENSRGASLAADLIEEFLAQHMQTLSGLPRTSPRLC
jgi:UDP:flavonoid glycosyltransferase YjiC (YdhE family)